MLVVVDFDWYGLLNHISSCFLLKFNAGFAALAHGGVVVLGFVTLFPTNRTFCLVRT